MDACQAMKGSVWVKRKYQQALITKFHLGRPSDPNHYSLKDKKTI